MELKEYFKGFAFFWKGLKAAKEDMWTSLQVLVVLTLLLTYIQYLFENNSQPDVFTNYWDSLGWSFLSYLGNPGNFSPGEPITPIGRSISIILAIIKILIFAVPAGLVANGFRETMDNDKRKKELEIFRNKMLREFKAGTNSKLRDYLKELPVDENAWYHGCKFGSITDNVSVAKCQIKGMDLKDIIDVCKEYPEFRIQNEAFARGIEEKGRVDRFMIEHFPINRKYGCCFNRHSKVTIVSPNSRKEICSGNFSYHLAKFAGFNYISVDLVAADGENYATNHWEGTFYEGRTLEERGKKVSKKINKAYNEKEELKELFLKDLKELCKQDGAWVICFMSHKKSADNKFDVHFSHTLDDGSNSSILFNRDKYEDIVSSLQANLPQNMKIVVESNSKLPLIKRGTFRSLIYKLNDDKIKCNGFNLYVSSQLMQFNTKIRIIQFILAKTIHDVIEPERNPFIDEGDYFGTQELKDLNQTSRFYGYPKHEQLVDDFKEDIIKMCEE